jgi:hypothetical protein
LEIIIKIIHAFVITCHGIYPFSHYNKTTCFHGNFYVINNSYRYPEAKTNQISQYPERRDQYLDDGGWWMVDESPAGFAPA